MENNSDDSLVNPETTTSHQEDLSALALKDYKVDEKTGKVVIPQGSPQYVVTALKLEQQRRDSNSNYSKERARADKAEAKNSALEKQISQLATPQGMSPEQTAELEELKFTDPDQWYARKLAIETGNATQATVRASDAIETANKDAETAYTNDMSKRRDESIEQLLTSHNALNPETPITMEMLNLDIPPSLINGLHKGTFAPPEFLQQVSKFLYADTVIKTEDVLGQPSLSDGSSTTTASAKAEEQSMEQLYAGL